ncbi:unnamed protein product [Xylocopa violacea]|uniref:Odorant receptor n=1 Tax=Xylocopa violacea TaxID=135666 RepID=A0ABP1PH75_XYLVO
MHTLQLIFKLLTLIGLLRPSSWKSIWKRALYHLYTTALSALMVAMETFLILDLFLNVDNQDDLSENLYVTLTLLSSCCKTFMLFIYLGDIKSLLDIIQEEPHVPVNDEEVEIRSRFEDRIEWNSMAYTVTLDCFTTLLWISALFTDFRHEKLKFRVWLPNCLSSPRLFTFNFVHQIVATLFSTNTNVIYDCLFSSLLIHIYCQFEILEHRMRNITINKNYSARLCAYHHDRIYKLALMVDNNFKMMTSIQFLISTGAVCFNLYRLSLLTFGSKFVETSCYTLCLLLQIFYYCWFGNEVKLKSLEVSDTVLKCDLTSLDEKSKKILLLIMRRALEPVQFTSLHVISMNIECFTSVTAEDFLFSVQRAPTEQCTIE